MQNCPFCKTEIHDDASVCPSCNAEYGINCFGRIRYKENCVREGRNFFLVVFLVFVAAVSIGFVNNNCIPCWIIGFGGGVLTIMAFVMWMIVLMKKESWWH